MDIRPLGSARVCRGEKHGRGSGVIRHRPIFIGHQGHGIMQFGVAHNGDIFPQRLQRLQCFCELEISSLPHGRPEIFGPSNRGAPGRAMDHFNRNEAGPRGRRSVSESRLRWNHRLKKWQAYRHSQSAQHGPSGEMSPGDEHRSHPFF